MGTGRRAEIARVDRLLAAPDGGIRFVEVAGEPGIGKSQFLAEVCEVTRRRSWAVVSFRAPYDGGRPADLPGRLVVTVDDLHRADTAWLDAFVGLVLDPARAAAWWTAADRLLPDQPETRPRRLRLRAAQARALCLAGRYVESRELVHDLLDQLPARDAEAVDLVRLVGTVEHALGRHDEAAALLEADLCRFDPDDPVILPLKADL